MYEISVMWSKCSSSSLSPPFEPERLERPDLAETTDLSKFDYSRLSTNSFESSDCGNRTSAKHFSKCL